MIVGSEVTHDNQLMISYYNDKGKVDFIRKRLVDHEVFNWVESTSATTTKTGMASSLKRAQLKANG